MPNNLTEQQKKQAALFICNALSIANNRKFEVELKSNSALQDYVNELKHTVETTRQISTLEPTYELLQGSRNLLRGAIQTANNQTQNNSVFATVLNKIKNGFLSVVKTRQPVWAIATYIVIGIIAGRLLLTPNGDQTIDISNQANVDMNKLIQSGLLSDIKIDQSLMSPSAIKLASNTDKKFNVSGNVNDKNIRQILYYLLLNDKNPESRLQAGQLISKITQNSESMMVLISSVLSDTDKNVKLQSMESLSKYEPSDELINACKRILLDDRDAKMRLESLKVLENNKSSDLIPLLRVVSKMDDNLQVRDKANAILNDLQKPISLENSEVTQ